MSPVTDTDLIDIVTPLTRDASLGPVTKITPLSGGANNRAYRVDTDAGPFFLKVYYAPEPGGRNRLVSEYSFLSFAWEHGIQTVPRPVTWSETENIGLYEFVDGVRCSAERLTDLHSAGAVRFIRELQGLRNVPEALDLIPAAEACFTINEHLESLRRRVKRLADITVDNETVEIDRDVRRWVEEEMLPVCAQTTEWAHAATIAAAVNPADPLPMVDRCLSPSDFGFHNAICRPDGTVCFVDFEYAGWDDPAKLVGDYRSQPELPVPAGFGKQLLQALCETSDDPDACRWRCELLLPVCRLKWCCILLNEFLPAAGKRRQFAGRRPAGIVTKTRQLTKAKRMLQAVHTREAEWATC